MRTWIIGLMTALLAACATVEEKSREARFNDIARLYAKTIEWSEFGSLPAFARFSAEHPPPDPKRFQHIRITDYQPGPGVTLGDNRTVVRRVQIHYVESSRMSAHALTVEEVWVYSEEDRSWFLRSGWPSF